ncbi:hypothetical protein [Leifsonia sp. C5G2]|uniref:hypothetical protein n=1 Tax=Leifsonia sp. C5G2 TaxID=2735269 RepID=UPI0015853704|nr:hypothetical protein [Leifsonia sp. C5G2]NUU08651.1 hypothetical protein [Leifsonia sp. C5G2]
MARHWTWQERQRVFLIAMVIGWAAYLSSVVLLLLSFEPFIFEQPAGAALVIAIFASIPAGIQVIWLLNPGFFYVSRLRFDPAVTAHLRPSLQSHAWLGGSLNNLRSTNSVVPDRLRLVSIRTIWDQWTHTASGLVGAPRPGPKTGSVARVEISSRGAEFLVGYWRPGRVLHVPASNIVGLWKGSEIGSIGGRQVLVLVIKTSGDDVVFPLQVRRWSIGDTDSRDVDLLMSEFGQILGKARDEADQ